MKHLWLLDPAITFLNHGSFGATPIAILAKQDEFRTQLEREPVRFMNRELEPLLDASRAAVAQFVGAEPADIAFVPNATAGVNSVLRSLDLDKLDELLVTDQEYNATRNTLDYVAGLAGAKIVVAEIPFPIASPEVVIERVLEKVTDRTRLVILDHIVSQTALINPIARLIQQLKVDVLIDGAHAPGQIPLNLRELGGAYYTANLHKWVCAPKGAAFLYARKNRRISLRPISISHGANATRTDRSRFHLEFDWTGTFDPSAWLCAGESIRYMASLVGGGWPEIMRRNHDLALRARDLLCAKLHIDKPAPDEMVGSMAAFPLSDGDFNELQDALFAKGIEVPIMPWPRFGKRLLRISAQLYNTIDDYERLAAAL
ncbi:MAG TPA: aminotransferase class V-fold PLP-dependent enzyme [Thermoanaerobaculia bacterium]|nr:aminotransferase class V-fold PLP-dependent enzyme [Thermoanaerobaculia bacterium]